MKKNGINKYMDYKVKLSNIPLNEDNRVEIEKHLFDLKDISSTYFETIAEICKIQENSYTCTLALKRDNHILSTEKIEEKSLISVLEKAKESLTEKALIEFVQMSA